MDFGKLDIGENTFQFLVPTEQLVASEYDVGLVFLERSEFGSNSEIDVIINAFTIKIMKIIIFIGILANGDMLNYHMQKLNRIELFNTGSCIKRM